MIRQAGDHGRGPLTPLTIGYLLAEGSHGAAEVVAVHREVGHRLMYVPVLREAVTLSHLAGVTVAVGAVVPLHQGGVDSLADPRLLQGCRQRHQRSEDPSEVDLHHPPLFPRFVDRGVLQPLGRDLVRTLGTPRPASPLGKDFLAVSLQDRRFIGPVFVGGDQVRDAAGHPLFHIVDELLHVFRGPLPRHHAGAPSDARDRNPHGPSGRLGVDRRGYRDRSAFPFCPRRPIFRRTGPRASPGEKATNSACNSWAWCPARRAYRVTVSRCTSTKRLVLRTPQPSARCDKTATTFSSGSRVSNSGVPFRSA